MKAVQRGSLASAWMPTQGQQSIDFARYRWGGTSDAGFGALFTLTFPPMGMSSGVSATLDIGISIEAPVPLVTVALLLRDSILVVASQVPVAIADLLPPGCEVERVEGTFSASTMTGLSDPGGRANRLSERVDWTSLGTVPANFDQAGFAVTPGEAVGPTVASQIIVEGINHMALSHGFLDPRHGVALLRDALVATTWPPPPSGTARAPQGS